MSEKRSAPGRSIGSSEGRDVEAGLSGRDLGGSYRQAKRLWQRCGQRGTDGLVPGNAGRRSNQAKPKGVGNACWVWCGSITAVVGERFGPQLAAEHLEEEPGVRVHPETLRLWMLEGLWSGQRKRKAYRRRRERKAHFGELGRCRAQPRHAPGSAGEETAPAADRHEGRDQRLSSATVLGGS
jgi:hypothetical protein